MAPAERTGPIPASHVVAVPYPGRGHVNPMMNLCKLLTNAQPDLLVTFVVTEEWLGLIGAEDKPPGVRFATIPNVLPSELSRAADMVEFVGATQTRMAEPFERLLDRLGSPPVSYIVADTFLDWAVDVGVRRGIPVASLWPMPASVFSVFYHFDLLVRNGHHPFDVSERGDERVDYIPGIASIRLADTPSIAHMKDQRLLNLALRIFKNIHKAQCILLTTMYELEPRAIEALKQEFSFPVYSFGPAVPYFNLQKPTSVLANGNDHHYFEWLNSQPPSSVLYVSLGSFLSVSSAQMDEIADGLRESGVRFLWVARGEADRLQEKCGDRGRVVPWCEQLRVLSHSSVGGFWTHCGWNSTMEGIFAGVPIIAFPIIMDQSTVRKHVIEDWKIGLDAKKDVRIGDLLKSQQIAELVKNFMDLENIERKDMTRRAKELREVTLRAISDGGSSDANLRSFLDDIASSGEET